MKCNWFYDAAVYQIGLYTALLSMLRYGSPTGIWLIGLPEGAHGLALCGAYLLAHTPSLTEPSNLFNHTRGWWGFLIYPHNRMGTRLQSPVPQWSSSCDNDATPTLLLVIYILSAVHILIPVNENMMFSVANSLRFYIHYHTWIPVSLHFGRTRQDFNWFPLKMSQDLSLQDKFFSSRKHFALDPESQLGLDSVASWRNTW